VSHTIREVHPDLGLIGLDAMNGGIAANTANATDRVRRGRERCQRNAERSALQQRLLLRKPGLVQALGMALIPPKPAPQKESLSRPRNLFGAHLIAPPAAQVDAIAPRAQSGCSSPRSMAQQRPCDGQVPGRRKQEEPRAAHYQDRTQCRYRGRAEFVRRPQAGFQRIAH